MTTAFAQMKVGSQDEEVIYSQITKKIARTAENFAEKRKDFEKLRASRKERGRADAGIICQAFGAWNTVFQDRVANEAELSQLSLQNRFTAHKSQVLDLLHKSVSDLIADQKIFDTIAAAEGCQLSGRKSDGSFNESARYNPFGDFDYFGTTGEINKKPLNAAEKAVQKTALDQFIAEMVIEDAQDLITQGYYDQALRNLNEIISKYPNNSDALTARAQIYHAQNKLDLLIADADKAIALDSKNALAYWVRAAAFNLKSDFEKGAADNKTALELVNQAIAQNPQVSVNYFIRAKILVSGGKFDAAIADYSKALEINPQMTAAYAGRGFAFLIKFDSYYEALKDFNKVIETFPKAIYAYKNRGLVYRKLGEFEKSSDDLRYAVALDPANEGLRDFLRDTVKPETSEEIIDRYNYFAKLYRKAADVAEQKMSGLEAAAKVLGNPAFCGALSEFYDSFKSDRTAYEKLLFINQHAEIKELKMHISENELLKNDFGTLLTVIKNLNSKEDCHLQVQ